MAMYTIQTDAFLADEIEADTLDEAIELAFDGEGLGKITDLETLQRKFAKYVQNGGWCRIECDDEMIVEIGTP